MSFIKNVGRALANIHSEPKKYQTISSLAKEASISRSGFSANFTQLVGGSDKRYLTNCVCNWRLLNCKKARIPSIFSLIGAMLGFSGILILVGWDAARGLGDNLL